jgi:hypothetical protein
MFEASHASPILDYFRVPYAVGAAPTVADPTATPPSLGRLQTPSNGRTSRSLWWPRAGEHAQLGTVRPARYQLGKSWLVGHVLADDRARQLLPHLGAGWRPIATIRCVTGASAASVWRDGTGNVFLPFDMGEVMENFWSERYQWVGRSPRRAQARAAVLRGYYLARPAIPRPAQLALRRRLSRIQARSDFPRWPIEDSLHDLYAWFLGLLAETAGQPIPWLDMWPDGRSWALVLTHDVETDVGVGNIHLLRDPERAAGYRSSWNFVPERYQVDGSVLDSLRNEGCEIGVHGLRHDGHDLGSRALFERRLPAIRRYAEQWQAVGFRSPATQRVWEWMPELGFDYDCSYTDTDPYEPQPGGCCSYLPYFNQEQVELPITLPQDHTLFAILGHADGDLWVEKARHLRARGGMALALAHPDYAADDRLAGAWQRLLEEFRDDGTAWKALPREVAAWWRRRAASSIRETAQGWRIEGPAAAEGRVRLVTPVDAPAGIGVVTP